MNAHQTFPDRVRWRTLGVAFTGRGHVLSGEPCQDRHTVASLLNGDLVVIVADGAGSAEFSDEGARVAAETCLTQIAERARHKRLVRLDYYEIFHSAAEQVSHYARSFNLSPREFATTLNVLHCTRSGTANVSIGDSGCIIVTGQDELEILAPPFKGRYANETAFLSQSMVERYFSYGETRNPINGYIAATDGIFDLLFQQDQINTQSAHALIDCLRRQESPQAAKELTAFCQSGTIARFTRDDLTLVLGLREEDA
jgi:serine/threonine protein phosphatase PrpC